MFPGLNPKDVAKAMKKLGIQQEEIQATEVIIKTPEKEIIILQPSVAKVNMMGQETFQISGRIEERAASTEPEISEEDISTVMERTGASRESAVNAIKKHKGDLASAILELKI